MKVSRRKLMLVAAAATTAVQGLAQAPPNPQPEGDVEAARTQQRANGEAIARVPLPMTIEPAFQFKA